MKTSWWFLLHVYISCIYFWWIEKNSWIHFFFFRNRYFIYLFLDIYLFISERAHSHGGGRGRESLSRLCVDGRVDTGFDLTTKSQKLNRLSHPDRCPWLHALQTLLLISYPQVCSAKHYELHSKGDTVSGFPTPAPINQKEVSFPE